MYDSDWEELRKDQLAFLEYWNRSFIIPHRKELGHHNFMIDLEYIDKLTIGDLVKFTDNSNMCFEKYRTFFGHTQIVFRDKEW